MELLERPLKYVDLFDVFSISVDVLVGFGDEALYPSFLCLESHPVGGLNGPPTVLNAILSSD